jgi:hypothetical protein
VSYAVAGIVAGALYWILIGHAIISWPFFVVLLAFAALFFWIGVKLLQLRYWALIAGRILAVWTGVSNLALLSSGRFAVGPPVLTILRLAQVALALAIAIALFLPGVSNAIKKPQPLASE